MVSGISDFIYSNAREVHRALEKVPFMAVSDFFMAPTAELADIVLLDDELCSGCASCIEACPYDAIDFDEENGLARKCNLCHHRVDRGLIPACADNVCLAHCIYFGDPGNG